MRRVSTYQLCKGQISRDAKLCFVTITGVIDMGDGRYGWVGTRIGVVCESLQYFAEDIKSWNGARGNGGDRDDEVGYHRVLLEIINGDALIPETREEIEEGVKRYRAYSAAAKKQRA